jgi:ABC-type uncharacterized transport system substrate-binding protein
MLRSFWVLLSLWTVLGAHPHTFIDVYPTLGKERIAIRWVIDEMSSQMLILDFDSDGDGSLSPAESDRLRDELFTSLHDYGYYTYFYRGGKRLPSPKAADFRATIEEYRIHYQFTLPLPEGTETIRFYDAENFSAFFVKDVNGRSWKCRKLDEEFGFGYELEHQ